MNRPLATLLSALWALLWLVGCGSSPAAEPNVAIGPEPDAPKPRNAHEIARAIVGGKLDILLYVEPLRKLSVGPKVAALPAFREVFEGTDIQPLRDFDRVYVTAASTKAGEPVVMVGEHELAEERMRAALDAMIARSEPKGAWLPDATVPAARIHVRGERMVVGLVEPNVVVIVAESKASDLGRFVGTGGLPDPVGEEAALATAVDPARTIVGPPFRIPPTIVNARALITPADDGGVDLHVEGQSTSEEQAKADAEELTQSIADVTTVKIAVVKVKLFEPVEFRADKKLVKGDRHLSPAELERIFGLVSTAMGE
ncbi:MAG: hypothetical protein JRI23_11865 [Deltaproteobacteria bacterium]|jgi:hypothetical protein|nr:hypothetical protein [Deltaproteobacteria bacterium]MBW2532404.1 hypothetical protein [Deltaproteobacteria bacterium]